MDQRILTEYIYTNDKKYAYCVFEDREKLQAPMPERGGYTLRGKRWIIPSSHERRFRQAGSPKKGLWIYVM